MRCDLEDMIERTRRLLTRRGYCGEGDLAQMVSRALSEAEDRGRNEETIARMVLQETSALFPIEWIGSVPHRTRRVLEENKELRKKLEKMEAAEYE